MLRVKNNYAEDAEAQSYAEEASQPVAPTLAAQALTADAVRAVAGARRGAPVLPHASMWKDQRTPPWTGLGWSIGEKSISWNRG